MSPEQAWWAVQDCIFALQPQDLTLIPNDFPPAPDHCCHQLWRI
jgi:hypothetical protein